MNPKLIKEIGGILYIFLPQPVSSSTPASSPPPRVLGKYNEDGVGLYMPVNGERFRPVEIVDGNLITVDSNLLARIESYRNQPRTIQRSGRKLPYT